MFSKAVLPFKTTQDQEGQWAQVAPGAYVLAFVGTGDGHVSTPNLKVQNPELAEQPPLHKWRTPHQQALFRALNY